MSFPSTVMNVQLEAPVRFSPSVERPDADEAKTTEALIETLQYINEKTFADGGHAIRSVHAKTHGILQGYLEVDAGLPHDLAQGLFAKPGRYPIVMRFSTIPGDILDDSVSTPRALAIKVIGVEGERLEGSEGDVTQDFVLNNGPAFGAPNPKKVPCKAEAVGKNNQQGPTAQENSIRGDASGAKGNRCDYRRSEFDGGNPWRTPSNPYPR
jgi:hypothetical protein